MERGACPTFKSQYGGIAQLGEHLLCKQGVSGSNPLISTRESESTSHRRGYRGCEVFIIGKAAGPHNSTLKTEQ